MLKLSRGKVLVHGPHRASVYGYTGTLCAKSQVELKGRGVARQGGGGGECVRAHWYTTNKQSGGEWPGLTAREEDAARVYVHWYTRPNSQVEVGRSYPHFGHHSSSKISVGPPAERAWGTGAEPVGEAAACRKTGARAAAADRAGPAGARLTPPPHRVSHPHPHPRSPRPRPRPRPHIHRGASWWWFRAPPPPPPSLPLSGPAHPSAS